MPGRDIPLVNDQIYHVFNRGIAGQPIFATKWDYRRFLDSMWFYQHTNVPVRYSKFLYLTVDERSKILSALKNKRDYIIDFISFCLMPNHFHFLLRQCTESGIAKFISLLCNSYTRYFNTKHNRSGPLLQGKFKAVRIQDDYQLLHAVRYIHLNPYTSYIVKSQNQLANYPYSSLSVYLSKANHSQLNREIVLENFKTKKSFEKFTFDQADYQRNLGKIKHLILEK